MRLTTAPSRRVVWEDGMHLTPQHFQAQRRYQEDQATRTVDPDKMNSNKVSLDRYAEPEEIADAVVFLCSPEAKFIHGQLLRVDGGLQLYAG